MRKTSASLAALSLVAVALTGCAAGTAAPTFEGAACERDASSSGIDDLVTVTGEFGEAPEVEVFSPLHVDSTGFTDLESGEGTALTAANQIAVIDVALYRGSTGDEIVTTEFNGDRSRLSNIASWEQQIPAIATVLECATPGTRMLAAFTPEDFGEQASQGFQLEADESVVAVIDVLDTYLPRATGELQFHDARGLPTVVRAPDGRPGIIVPDSAPPTELVTQVLIEGEGEEVTAETPFRVHYTGVTWAERTVFDTSWDADPAQFNLASVIPGFAEALEGQTVGSQVLIVVPPELGYGDQPQASIPANSTLVFVVDILGIDQVPSQ
ncbi:MAG: FKBP-type peptidyl-prolyl cis-trans isomerase [Actinomycetota bacterium]